MDLSASWPYLEEVARRRLAHNKTERHVSDYGPEIETLGAAGELAARRFLGMIETLHESFDGGADLIWRGWRVDVKATHLTPKVDHRFLQWPENKPIKADIILMTAIDLKHKTGVVMGYAFAGEIIAASVNYNRDYPCFEIPITQLHPAWELVVPGRYAPSRN